MKETLRSIETTVVKEVEGVTKSLEKQALHYRKSVFERFPFLMIGLSTFGFVATLYGFEKIIDTIDFLAARPVLILTTGLLTLILTGSLYKKLS